MTSHAVLQGSPAWHQLRLGKPTASCFDQIVTPAKGELSKSSDRYLNTLLAERFLGYPMDAFSSKAMETGREREPEAAAWYEFDRNIETQVVGICFTDDGLVGASPDRLVGDKGLLEIKCPNPDTHIGYLRSDAGISRAYWPQIQGQLWVAEREWLDSISYCHGFPPSVFRVHRDEGFIAKLSAALAQFVEQLEWEQRKLLALGCKLAEPRIASEADPDWLGVTEADVAELFAGRAARP